MHVKTIYRSLGVACWVGCCKRNLHCQILQCHNTCLGSEFIYHFQPVDVNTAPKIGDHQLFPTTLYGERSLTGIIFRAHRYQDNGAHYIHDKYVMLRSHGRPIALPVRVQGWQRDLSLQMPQAFCVFCS